MSVKPINSTTPKRWTKTSGIWKINSNVKPLASLAAQKPVNSTPEWKKQLIAKRNKIPATVGTVAQKLTPNLTQKITSDRLLALRIPAKRVSNMTKVHNQFSKLNRINQTKPIINIAKKFANQVSTANEKRIKLYETKLNPLTENQKQIINTNLSQQLQTAINTAKLSTAAETATPPVKAAIATPPVKAATVTSTPVKLSIAQNGIRSTATPLPTTFLANPGPSSFFRRNTPVQKNYKQQQKLMNELSSIKKERNTLIAKNPTRKHSSKIRELNSKRSDLRTKIAALSNKSINTNFNPIVQLNLKRKQHRKEFKQTQKDLDLEKAKFSEIRKKIEGLSEQIRRLELSSKNNKSVFDRFGKSSSNKLEEVKSELEKTNLQLQNSITKKTILETNVENISQKSNELNQHVTDFFGN